MIDKAEFMGAWGHLCQRFGREDDASQAAAYYGFLTEQMDTPGFLQAARAIWATSKWFPRPADFLLIAATGEWSTVVAAVENYTPPHGEWHPHWMAMSERSRAACRALGGISGMRTVYERGDLLRLKSEWERAYEQATTEEVLLLPPPTRMLAS